MKIEWDDTLQLSDKKYLSSEISTIQKDKFVDGTFQELNLTAKEWIMYEIEKCKRELVKNKIEIKLKEELKKDLKELVLLKKYFNKYITDIDILGLHRIGDDTRNQTLDENFTDMKNLINQKVKNKEQEIDSIQKLQTDIKRICFENIKLILQKDFEYQKILQGNKKAEIKTLQNEIKKYEQKRKENTITKEDIEQEEINRINIKELQNEIDKIKIQKNYSIIADTLLKIHNITLGKNHKQIIFDTGTYTQNNVELYIKKLTK